MRITIFQLEVKLAGCDKFQQLLRRLGEAQNSLANFHANITLLCHRHRDLPRIPVVEADLHSEFQAADFGKLVRRSRDEDHFVGRVGCRFPEVGLLIVAAHLSAPEKQVGPVSAERRRRSLFQSLVLFVHGKDLLSAQGLVQHGGVPRPSIGSRRGSAERGVHRRHSLDPPIRGLLFSHPLPGVFARLHHLKPGAFGPVETLGIKKRSGNKKNIRIIRAELEQ